MYLPNAFHCMITIPFVLFVLPPGKVVYSRKLLRNLTKNNVFITYPSKYQKGHHSSEAYLRWSFFLKAVIFAKKLHRRCIIGF